MKLAFFLWWTVLWILTHIYIHRTRHTIRTQYSFVTLKTSLMQIPLDIPCPPVASGNHWSVFHPMTLSLVNVIAFLAQQMSLVSRKLLHVSTVHSFILLSNILWCGLTTIILNSLLLEDIWVVSSFWLSPSS